MDQLRWMVKYWKQLLPVTGWVIATIATFWNPPLPDLPVESKTYVSFARFVVAVFLGIMILPMRRWSFRRHTLLWGGIAAAALVCGIAAFFGYQIQQQEWTTTYNGKLIFVGSELTEWAAKFKVAHPDEATKEALLESAAGNAKLVWTEKSLNRCRLILCAVYVLAMPFFAVAIIATAQVAFCVRAQKRRRT
jgi:predicted tellurium resistance membrane protein TerC